MRGLFAAALRLKPRRLHQRMQSPLQMISRQSHTRSFLFTSMVDNVSNFQGSRTLSNNLHKFAHYSTTISKGATWEETDKSSELNIKIISKENIKPASPTPNHLKTYEVSVIDQFFPHSYIPSLYFFPNDTPNQQDDKLVEKRMQLLKHSLSETLIRFYPFAGKVKDDRHIDCNDDGVYYIEAKTTNLMSDFLKQPDNNKSINNLLPFDPNNSVELMSKTYVNMIQVTVFGCGGIAIGIYASHKIIDGYSLGTFLKAWATTARGCSKKICPNYIAPSIFPSNPTLHANVTDFTPSMFLGKSKRARFVFHASSMKSLKEKAETSSRVMAVTGLLWKCIMSASSKARLKDTSNHEVIQTTSALSMTVNLRGRCSPPMPPYTIGNIIWSATTIMSSDDGLRLPSIVQGLKKSIDSIDNSFIGKMKEKWSLEGKELQDEINSFKSEEKIDHIYVTSACNMGLREFDFGWGKPIWEIDGKTSNDVSLFNNVITLLDTGSGNGIEARVVLSEEEMAYLERDKELLSFASVNPSPLDTVDW